MAVTLLFLPGTLCDGRVWSKPFAALSGEWKCDVANYRYLESIPAMAAAALDQAEGAVIPIGVSMGAIVALEMWHQAAERVAALALFDVDPGADSHERRERRDAQVLEATHGNFLAMIESQLAPAYFSAGRQTDVALRDLVVAMALDQGVGTFAAQATALATRPDAWPLLKDIHVPALIACGSEDRICPVEKHVQMASLLPFATFHTIQEAGHLAPLEQPVATTRVLRAWLNSILIAKTLPAYCSQVSPVEQP